MPFKKGNKGRPVGTKNIKTQQWDELSTSISEQHSINFNAFMDDLWNGSKEDKYKAANLFLQVLKYFKPRMSSVEATINEPTTISVIRFEDAKPRNN